MLHSAATRTPVSEDVALDRDVVDDWEHRVDHVAGAAQQREGPGGERRQEGDVFRVSPQDLLGELHHDVKAARTLQHGRAPDHRQNCQHDADRWFTRGQPEDEDEDEQANAEDEPEPDASIVGAEKQAREDDDDLEREDHGDQLCGGWRLPQGAGDVPDPKDRTPENRRRFTKQIILRSASPWPGRTSPSRMT